MGEICRNSSAGDQLRTTQLSRSTNLLSCRNGH